VQTPGVSHFFGCRPLGPIGWSIAFSASAGATLGGVLWNRVEDRVLAFLNELLERATSEASPAAAAGIGNDSPLTAADLLRSAGFPIPSPPSTPARS
jgi:hypothetical protein